MRVLAVCEDPPATGVRGNGSTMIVANLLPRLADDVDLDLAYYRSRAPVDPAVLARADVVVELPLRSHRASIATMPATRLPRATWRRTGRAALREVSRLAAAADVVYVHGLHAFGVLRALPPSVPVVVHEIDPWSRFWHQRAATGSGPTAYYDRLQAARAERLERLAGERAATVLVVSPEDARWLAGGIAAPVRALPNGIGVEVATSLPSPPDEPLIAFAGSLDYGPNVEAATTLVRDVLPLVSARRPDARVVLAGRSPGPAVQALAGDRVRVLADVADMTDVYRSAAVMAFPDASGFGTRNAVLEALACGAAVVAGPRAARSVADAGQLVLAATAPELADAVVSLLDDQRRRSELMARALAWSRELPTWAAAARQLDDVLAQAVGAARVSDSR